MWNRLRSYAAPRVRQIASSKTGRNALSMLAGQGLRVAIQAVYFFFIARVLGPRGYGAFVGVTAFVAILAPFASMGTGGLLVRAIARAPERFGAHWGGTLALAIAGGIAFSAVGLPIARVVLPGSVSTALLVCVFLSDLLFCRIVELAGQAFQGFEQLTGTALVQTALNTSRLVAVAVLWSTDRSADATTWGAAYCASSFLVAGIAMIAVQRRFGAPACPDRLRLAELRDGAGFAIQAAATTANNDLDKTMLARLSTLQATGVYASAYRIIDVALSPLRSLFAATYASFFREGHRGRAHAARFAVRLLPIVTGLGVASIVIVYAAAAFVPIVLGTQYTETADVLRLLCPLPLLRGLQYLGGDVLTATGYQGRRGLLHAAIAVLNFGLNLLWIPSSSWRGAAFASLVCDGGLAILLCGFAAWVTARTTMHSDANTSAAMP